MLPDSPRSDLERKSSTSLWGVTQTRTEPAASSQARHTNRVLIVGTEIPEFRFIFEQKAKAVSSRTAYSRTRNATIASHPSQATMCAVTIAIPSSSAQSAGATAASIPTFPAVAAVSGHEQ